MLELLSMTEWSPYVVGLGIGLVSCAAFVLSDKPIGCSTAFARTSGMLEAKFRGERVREMPYYRQFIPKIDWEWMLVLGIVLGSFTSALLSGELHLEWVPSRWAAEFGGNPLLRLLTALIGGIFLGFGARWAGGCTSGHGISGTLQLAVSGWLAVCAFFAGGAAGAFLLYGG
ncbi:MAG: YeeE/YedE thiosulfate transporter family protein [Trichloromonas sp.]|jgi:uncharacterized membrane protein YedE/YeeE|nr:YeeE/YedE thiosulfate transporter family protein [Trichloromonas sp.]